MAIEEALKRTEVFLGLDDSDLHAANPSNFGISRTRIIKSVFSALRVARPYIPSRAVAT